MRIGRADFDLRHMGRVHQALLAVVPEDEAVTESELRQAYDAVNEESKPPFEQVLANLSPFLARQSIGSQTFYVRRGPWLSTREVAAAMGVSKRTVQSWYQQGKLLGQQVGGRLRFATEAVEEWMKGTRAAPAQRTTGDPSATEVWNNERDAAYDRR